MGTRAEFITPIYVADVDEDERKAIEAEIDQLDVLFKPGTEYGLESSALVTPIGDNVLASESPKTLKAALSKHLNKYLNDIDSPVTNVKIHSSWLTKTLKGQSIETHSHIDKDISGVYYVNSNGEDGDLVLYSSNYATGITKFISSGNRINIPPKQGQIVFFPSWLLHSTTRNTTNNDRISLALDIVVET